MEQRPTNENIKLQIITTELPGMVAGTSVKDGESSYKVFINSNRPDKRQAAAFLHECLHIWHHDFDKDVSITALEEERHREITELLQLLQDEG